MQTLLQLLGFGSSSVPKSRAKAAPPCALQGRQLEISPPSCPWESFGMSFHLRASPTCSPSALPVVGLGKSPDPSAMAMCTPPVGAEHASERGISFWKRWSWEWPVMARRSPDPQSCGRRVRQGSVEALFWQPGCIPGGWTAPGCGEGPWG